MGKKTREKLFSRNTRISQAKNDGEKSSGKSVKTRFFINTRISLREIRGKNARKKFSRNTRISQAKNDGKKSSGKSAKTRFFINTRIS